MSDPFAKPQHVFGQCSDCGAIAWELLSGISPYCMGCDSASYRQDSEEDYEEGTARVAAGCPPPESSQGA